MACRERAVVGVVVAAMGCGAQSPLTADPPPAGTSALSADPSPSLSFTQNALAVGINRAVEPPSAAVYPTPKLGTLSYGTFLADLDGDSLLDVYDVNHGQGAHLSGMWMNDGAGAFGPNLWTVAVAPAATKGANLGLTNDISYVGDFNGDGRVDIYFLDWSGLGGLCVNTGTAAHGDWTGPGFDCYTALEPRAFGDVNGDGRIDVQVVDPSAPYDVYKDWARTLPTSWRLNNGDPNFNSWPSDANDFHFVGKAAPGVLLDFNKDGLPDRLQAIEVDPSLRGPFALKSGGLVVSLGQAGGTYAPVTSGLEAVTDPVSRVEDVDEDGCLDVGVDRTGYRDNQFWYLQDRSGAACLATFHYVDRTTLPYHPGYKHYSVDFDNDGLVDKAVIIHNGYGANDRKAGGVHLYRKLPAGGYADLGAAGIGIDGTNASEFYADQLCPGDWNDDGKIDFAGVGQPSIPGAEAGIALWTSNLTTTNGWLKVKLPSVTGFFVGAATIELFDAGFAGDAGHLVGPPKVLRTGEAWASNVYHFGVGTRATVDVRVTFPDGKQTVQTGVASNATVTIGGAGSSLALAPPPPGDSVPPVLALDRFTITPAVTDDVGVASVICSVDGVDQAPATAAPFSFTLTLGPLASGAHVVSCRATDRAGNVSPAASFSFTR
jgi:hypothetical protein